MFHRQSFHFDTRGHRTGKKTPGGAGTHTGHTGHTGARGQTDHTDEPHNRPPKPKDTNPHENRDRLNTSTAARTAASPESTAPRGRLYRYQGTAPQALRSCLSVNTGKKTPGEPGHTRDTRDSNKPLTHGHTDHTDAGTDEPQASLTVNTTLQAFKGPELPERASARRTLLKDRHPHASLHP